MKEGQHYFILESRRGAVRSHNTERESEVGERGGGEGE